MKQPNEIEVRFENHKIYILLSIKTRIETVLGIINGLRWRLFISYYPLKQGLKLELEPSPIPREDIYILLSIKTRIETLRRLASRFVLLLFISYYPLKQGLKLSRVFFISLIFLLIYILLSIKTRIETITQHFHIAKISHLYPTIH